MTQIILAALVLLPMAAAPASYLTGRRSKPARDWLVLAVCAAEFALSLALLTAGEGTLVLTQWCGLGLAFQSGGLRTALAVLAAAGWLVGTLMLREYFAHEKRRNRYYVFWLLTLGATQGVFLSADLLTTYIFFELMSFTSFVFVIQTEKEDAIRAGKTYLAVAVISGLATLTGLFLLYYLTGTLSIDHLYDAVQKAGYTPMMWTAGILASVGFLAKAGSFPLHIWLPTAHPAAPAPASAVLSGVIIKSGVFGLLAVSVQVFRFQIPWGRLILILGLVTMVLGAVLAVFSTDLKRTLACSSVSQIGFILVGVAMQTLLGAEGVLAAEGTVLHLFNHASIKLILFPVAGVIYCTAHSYDLNQIRGFGRNKPWLAVITAIPMLSLAGVPGFSGYVSKTLLHESMVEYIASLGGSALYTAAEWVFLITGGLTVAYLLKLFIAIFVEKPLPGTALERGGRYMTRTSGVTLTVCAAALIPLGLLPNRLMEGLAGFTIPFLTDSPVRPVDYFSLESLKGSLISLAIGAAVYLLVVRGLLRTRDGAYPDRWPAWLNLEDRVYRPLLLTVLPLIGGVVARAAETLIDGLTFVMGRGIYFRQTRTAEPNMDPEFAAFRSEPPPRTGFRYSFAYSLMLVGMGVVVGLIYLMLS